MVALVLAASGTAVAATKMVSGDSLIKQQSLSGNRLRNSTVTGKQIKVSTLGTVPSAAKADVATSATTAGSAPISSVTYVTSSGSIPGDGGTAAHLLTANCPSGTTVIGGGANVADEHTEIVNDSYPNGKTGWSADFYNGDTQAWSATVTAICAPAAATAS